MVEKDTSLVVTSTPLFQRLLEELAKEHARELEQAQSVVEQAQSVVEHLREEIRYLSNKSLDIPIVLDEGASTEDVPVWPVKPLLPPPLQQLDIADESTDEESQPPDFPLSPPPLKPPSMFGQDLTLEVAPASQVPPVPQRPILQVVEGQKLLLTWCIPEIEPPVSNTAVKVRAVSGTWKLLDTREGKNVLVSAGGQSVQAPICSILMSTLQPGIAYEASVMMKNSAGWSEVSPISAAAMLQVTGQPGDKDSTLVMENDNGPTEFAGIMAGNTLGSEADGQSIHCKSFASCRSNSSSMPSRFPLNDVWADCINQRQAHGSIYGEDSGIPTNNTSALRLAHTVCGAGIDKGANDKRVYSPGMTGVVERLIADPSSLHRLVWDTLGVFLIGYDIIMVPMAVFRLPDSIFLRVMGWLTLLFWSCDIVASFLSGYVHEGFTIMNPSMVAKHYLKTWFIPDIVIVCADWMYSLAYLLGGDTSESDVGGVGRLARVMRALRALRLVRLLKLKQILSHIQHHIASEYLSMLGDVLKLITFMLVLSHLIACVWYAIGDAGERGNINNWIQSYELEQSSLEMRYVMSLHWSQTQLVLESMDVVAANTYERWFTIATLNFGLLIFSSVVSRITNSMMRLQRMGQDTSTQFWRLRRYFRERNVPKALAARVQRYLEYVCEKHKEHVQESEVQILSLLSGQLRDELQYTIVLPQLSSHILFDHINKVSDVAMLRLSRLAIERKAFACDDSLFYHAEVATHMYFVASGEGFYVKKSSHDVFQVCSGDWLCEPCLWTSWTHRGNLNWTSVCDVVAIDASGFGETMRSNPLTWSVATDYAEAIVEHYSMLPTDQLTDLPIFSPGDEQHERMIPALHASKNVYLGDSLQRESSTHSHQTIWSSLRSSKDSGHRQSRGSCDSRLHPFDG